MGAFAQAKKKFPNQQKIITDFGQVSWPDRKKLGRKSVSPEFDEEENFFGGKITPVQRSRLSIAAHFCEIV